MADTLDFPERQEVSFKIGDKSFILREAGGLAAKKYKLSMLNAAKMNKEGEASGIDSKVFVEKDYQLLCDCICTHDHKPVPMEQLLAWPERAISKLIDRCKEMSDLDQVGGADGIRQQMTALQKQLDKIEGKDTPKELAKNEQSSGETSSPTV